MTVIRSVHEDHGATFGDRGGRQVVRHFGRPARTHRAVRNGVGLIEMAYGVLTIEGDDRVSYVDNVVSNTVPTENGEGTYALVLDPQGGIETDMYVYNAGERLLLFLPPQRAEPLAEEWRGKTFIEDVEIDVATDEFAVFGLHGPKSTEKVASVLNKTGAPDQTLSFVRGSMGDAGVTVIRTDALAGEDGYEVVCAASEAEHVYDTLLNHGLNAAPFGYDSWETLTLEAGTPLFETELAGTVPNVLGLRNAVDFEKGCFVGQEVVSRVENRGRPSKRLVGLTCEALPATGAAVFDGDASAGEVTRAAETELIDQPIALALVGVDAAEAEEFTVRVDGEDVSATITELPFVEGSDRSARLPSYE
ncbi:CAF17-like 4Fe-4S cluster assembly/insertion protein YgfZ [Natranaeroarchaeum sulfidigenes]|uniref:Glycine cleavage system T protein (Aminomethyltransferase) n=1 Tax=Natranaeroarchaeum sulfidigenes TaxID=2784880 RepID=A0A897N1I8_9EURY|nr:aminomethyltransferase family protein [Natranaeroarchaeum sulfidigenes]QSG04196.1 Glycine cleavage system T protein (aminomethyltransferase) [Natranaeroarchaeum sulfidigenes]